MPRIFISYRRQDSSHQAGRLYDKLEEKFGAKNVFKDVDSIPLGADFRKVLDERIAACDVVLCLIGDRWLSADGENGRRLDDDGDFVRIEIESALIRNIQIIPILVGGAAMPSAKELPDTLKELSYRNALAVRPDPDFRSDAERLIRAVEIIPRRTRNQRKYSYKSIWHRMFFGRIHVRFKFSYFILFLIFCYVAITLAITFILN